MHNVVAWLGENFVPAWKAASILLTGGFGILGLMKNFKEKEVDQETDTTVEKITKWGWVSLIGIIVSTGLGVAAQLKESRDDARKALDTAKANTTTLSEIKKILSPLDIERVLITAGDGCKGPLLDRCSQLKHLGIKASSGNYIDNGGLNFEVFLFRSMEAFKSNRQSDVNFWVIADPNDRETAGRLRYSYDHSKDSLMVAADGSPIGLLSSGAIRSIDDLDGAFVWVEGGLDFWRKGDDGRMPSKMVLSIKGGRWLRTDDLEWEHTGEWVGRIGKIHLNESDVLSKGSKSSATDQDKSQQ